VDPGTPYHPPAVVALKWPSSTRTMTAQANRYIMVSLHDKNRERRVSTPYFSNIIADSPII
jgi:hypothetical protein